jgi:hypothetical protein
MNETAQKKWVEIENLLRLLAMLFDEDDSVFHCVVPPLLIYFPGSKPKFVSKGQM